MAEADGAQQVVQQPGGAPGPQGQGRAQIREYQPPPRAADNASPLNPPDSGSPADSTDPANLMRTVIIILGIALLVLVIFEGIAVLEGKTTNGLNTLISLIAGGFVGYLSPHVVTAVKGNATDKSGNQ
jgi:hypothetical protein